MWSLGMIVLEMVQGRPWHEAPPSSFIGNLLLLDLFCRYLPSLIANLPSDLIHLTSQEDASVKQILEELTSFVVEKDPKANPNQT